MAVHTDYPPDPDAEAIVRGDTETFVFRFQGPDGTDTDITDWTFRSHVRARFDGPLISACTEFSVAAPNEMGDMFDDDPSDTPCVLLCHWPPEETAKWKTRYVSDIEQLTPVKKTWLIIDHMRVDKDASYTEDEP
jgi:hypothetical protein